LLSLFEKCYEEFVKIIKSDDVITEYNINIIILACDNLHYHTTRFENIIDCEHIAHGHMLM